MSTINTLTNTEVPVYNPKGKETINQYIRRVEKYKTIILKEKYDLILQFVNELLLVNYESLTEFKNIKESILFKNDKHNRNIIVKYTDLFVKQFQIDLTTNYDDQYVIVFLNKLLDVIDYILIKKEFNNNIIYSIRKA